MQKWIGTLGLAFAVALPAAGAELPSKTTPPPPAAAKRCQINGKPGFVSADGQTCMAVGGYVSAHATTASH